MKHHVEKMWSVNRFFGFALALTWIKTLRSLQGLHWGNSIQTLKRKTQQHETHIKLSCLEFSRTNL